jgi:hypothetical protein
MTGLAGAMVVDASGTLLSAGRRIARQRAPATGTDTADATADADAMAGILSSGAGLLAIKVMAVATLVVVPFLN